MKFLILLSLVLAAQAGTDIPQCDIDPDEFCNNRELAFQCHMYFVTPAYCAQLEITQKCRSTGTATDWCASPKKMAECQMNASQCIAVDHGSYHHNYGSVV